MQQQQEIHTFMYKTCITRTFFQFSKTSPSHMIKSTLNKNNEGKIHFHYMEIRESGEKWK